MSNFVIKAYAISNTGKVRKNNEDNYFLNNYTVNQLNNTCAHLSRSKEAVMCVCDGMGGEESGEIASQTAVSVISEYSASILDDNCSSESILKCIETANLYICSLISQQKKRMGTTIALLAFKNDSITLANVGDSRIYSFSDMKLEQISKDHTEVQSLVDAGVLTKEEAQNKIEKHMLTQHLGIFPEEMIIEPYTVSKPVKNQQRFLLCSDGLTDMLSDDDIQFVLKKQLPVDKCVDTLRDIVLERGGKDNVTIMICEITESEADTAILDETVVLTSEECPVQDTNIKTKENPTKKFLNKNAITIVLGAILIAVTVVVLVVSFALKDNKTAAKNFFCKTEAETENII